LLEVFSVAIQKQIPDLIIRGPENAPEDLVRILARRAEVLSQNAELGPLLDQIEKAGAPFKKAHEERAKIREKSKWVLIQVSTINDDIKLTETRLNDIFLTIKSNIDDATRSRIENAFYELYSQNIFARFWGALLVTQPDTLTLWLVLLMGVLGSSLQVTHAYFKTGMAATLGGYLLRLAVGALAALIIFIAAKVGVPVIADAARTGSDASINPYFVSFLAIISGLLSENAIANIQAQGTRLLGQAGMQGQVRWSRRDLTPDLQKQNITITTLADHLEETDEKATAMLKGTESITQPQQKIIALALRADARDLFTDIAPPRR
jgi:hypothetical protein